MKIAAKLFVRLWFLCFALIPGVASAALLQSYEALYVFGDSLSDTGNDFIATTASGLSPAVPPSVSPNRSYYQGRFSNGPIAVEYLWRLLSRNNAAAVVPSLAGPPLDGKGAIAFAFGGSTSGVSSPTPGGFLVPGLIGQVSLFADAAKLKTPRQRALYTVWTGSNDYALQIASSPQSVIANITFAIESLYALGARDFLIPNLPDLGLTPFAVSKGLGPQLTQLTRLHNSLLKQAIEGLAAKYPAARFMQVNVFALGQVLVASGLVLTSPPALDYLKPGIGASSCLFTNPATCPDVNLAAPLPPFLFWDIMHPTTQVHSVIGLAMLAATATKGR